MTPVTMPTDWGLLLGMVVIAVVIAGLIWWHRTNPSVAKKELQDLLAGLKQPPVVNVPPPVDALFYNGIHFPSVQALQDYKLAEATVEHYKPK